MECPQCGGTLEEYALGEARAVHCPSCGYVGIDVELRTATGEDAESWEDALARYRRRE